METVKKIISPLVIPLVLSLILHGILIGGVSRLQFFDFSGGLTDLPITAFIISEKISKPLIQSHRARRPSATGNEKRPARSAEKPLPPSSQDGPFGETENTFAFNDKITDQESTEKNVPPVNTSKPLEVPEPSGANNSAPQKVTDSAGAPNSTGNNSVGAASGSSADITSASSQPHSGGDEKKISLLKKSREKLLYSLYWLDIYVGMAVLEASSNEGRITIKSQVHSAPFISVFYKVDDYAESTVVCGSPVNFRIKQHEGKYRSDKETVFDPVRRQIIFSNYIKGTTDDYPMNTSDVWDLISGFYYLRTQHVEVGKTIYIDVFDSNKFFTTEVSVIGKERIELSGTGEVDTVKVKPVIKSEGLFRNTGDILIWLTDDDDKTPVRIETKVPIGKVVAVLTSQETE